MTRLATLSIGLVLALQATPAATSDIAPHYLVLLEVYVTDETALCKQAWAVALADHGPALAEMLTMQRGKFEVTRCLATAVQKLPVDGVVRAGIEVTQQ
jgi:hypothetical protein